MYRLLIGFAVLLPILADGPGVIESLFSADESAPVADPEAKWWRDAKGVAASNDQFGKPVAGHQMEVRSRWTKNHLYLLFICPYEELHVIARPDTKKETNKLWDYDVAEVFIGSNPARPRRYTEFEVSPQGEWVDLDIDRDHPLPEGGWLWNSGFTVAARIDSAKKIWYGAMKIPYKSIDSRPASAGNDLRVNFYRIQGPPPDRKFVAWQPTQSPSYHVPESFGHMRLVK